MTHCLPNHKPFAISEVRRFLSTKTFDLWERIKQEEEIKQAGIEGLEVSVVAPPFDSQILTLTTQSCPYCHYSIIIENEQEKLFHCRNEDCCAVSCRKCRKPVCCGRTYHFNCKTDPYLRQAHLPKSCEGDDAACYKPLAPLIISTQKW